MKPQRAFLFAVLITAVIGIGVLLLSREPHYQGRSLTSWLQQSWDTPLMETQRLAEAQNAIRGIGPKKALPKLLKLVRSEDDPISMTIMHIGEEFRISDDIGDRFIRWHSAEDFWWLGERGFEVLGTNGAPAAEALGKLLDKPRRLLVIGRCLEFIGKPAEPVICQALTNQNVAVRQWAIDQLASVTDDVEVYITRIKPRLHDSSDAVRVTTVDAIGGQTSAPELAVPILIEALKDSAVSANAAGALANFGTNALIAFPILTNLVEHGGPNVAGAALKTIIIIDPDQSLPILTNCLARGKSGTAVALRALVDVAPERALPIILSRFQSPDTETRRVAFRLLCRYPLTPLVESALQAATTDSDLNMANRAKKLLTENRQKEHPLESQFLDDPSYDGKRLGEWLKMHERQGDYAFSPEATNAIQHIGTNAIPALLRRLVYVEPPFGLPAYEVNMDGVQGFLMIGDQATPALPQLQALLDGTNQGRVLYAMVSSLGTGTNAIPILTKGLTNQFAQVRGEAAHCLTEGISDRFPEHRQEIIRLLTNLLKDPDPDVRLSVKGDLQELNSPTPPTSK
jgi:HEAT repeat protein